MANLKGCFLHRSDDWSTPKDIYDFYLKSGWYDPCPLFATESCLSRDFYGRKLYINPPYSKLNDFIPWIIKQFQNGCIIDLLVPARTDTKWFHKLFEFISSITFIQGRLKFGNSKYGAPFPSIIIHLRHK